MFMVADPTGIFVVILLGVGGGSAVVWKMSRVWLFSFILKAPLIFRFSWVKLDDKEGQQLVVALLALLYLFLIMRLAVLV